MNKADILINLMIVMADWVDAEGSLSSIATVF